MTVYDLPRDCLIELKGNYIVELVNEGMFGQVVYNDDSIDEPSWGDFADVDELVPDDIVFDHYCDTCFEKDDFFCMEDVSYEEWERMEGRID